MPQLLSIEQVNRTLLLNNVYKHNQDEQNIENKRTKSNILIVCLSWKKSIIMFVIFSTIQVPLFVLNYQLFEVWNSYCYWRARSQWYTNMFRSKVKTHQCTSFSKNQSYILYRIMLRQKYNKLKVTILLNGFCNGMTIFEFKLISTIQTWKDDFVYSCPSSICARCQYWSWLPLEVYIG